MKRLPGMLAGAVVTMAAVMGPLHGQEKGPPATRPAGLAGRVLWTHETGG